MRITSHAILVILCAWGLWLSSISNVIAQNNSTESPYSRFGIGRLDRQVPHALRGMGDLSIAVQDHFLINPSNPASYAAVDSMTFLFDFGVSTGVNILTEKGGKDGRMIGNIDYITMLFPMGKYFALSAGLLPYSTVGYRYGSKEPIKNREDQFAARSYRGQGNLQEIYMGVSFSPVRYWSIGANVSFLFGKLRHERRITFDLPQSYNPTFLETTRMRALGVQLGTQGIIPLGDDKQELILGATYSPMLPIWSHQVVLNTQSRSGQPNELISSDTISSKSLFARPHSLGVGVSYRIDDKLLVGTDIQYSIWSKAFLDSSNTDYQGVNQWRVALGLSWTPDSRSSSYGKRIQYKAGLHGENGYLRITNPAGLYDSYYQMGGSLGIGLPMNDRRSNVDISLGYSYLYPTNRQGLAEHYVSLGLALRFNEAWFKPIRLD